MSAIEDYEPEIAVINRRKFLKVAAGTAIATSSSRLAAAAPIPEKKRPNILLISTDQQSINAMSCKIGKQYLNTPNMDSLATGGMQFTRAYAANPICSPSRTSMYSGRYPVETGIQVNPSVGNGKIKNHERGALKDPTAHKDATVHKDPAAHKIDSTAPKLDPIKFPCMGTVFKNAGYETAYFGKWHIPYPEDQTETHGFETVLPKTFDPKTAAEMVAFLNGHHDRPFLAVASFMNPHNICEWARAQSLPDGPIGDPPAAVACPPARVDLGSQKDEPAIMTLMRKSYQSTPTFPVGNFDEDKWRQYEWAYYRMVEKVDALIGQILEAVKANDMERDTVIVFFSDHGDCQGAHHWNQKTVFYEESAQVCFIVNWKGQIHAGSSERLVNTGIDLIPTVCEFAGITRPPHLPGESHMAHALGRKTPETREYVVASNDLAQGGPIDGITPRAQGRMVRSKRYKYCIYTSKDARVKDAPRESLVDFEKDPAEMVNVVNHPEYSKVLASHRAMLRDWAAKYNDTFPQHA